MGRQVPSSPAVRRRGRASGWLIKAALGALGGGGSQGEWGGRDRVYFLDLLPARWSQPDPQNLLLPSQAPLTQGRVKEFGLKP